MASLRSCFAVLLLAALQPHAALAANQCPSVPRLTSVDQAPTKPENRGKCTDALEADRRKASHWCNHKKPFLPWPAPPNGKAEQCLKFGRATIYRGPMYGSSTAHKAACNKMLRGSNKAAMVALSTKYLKTWQGGWNPSAPGACGQCLCVRLHGADRGYNPGLQTENAKKHVGLTFLGQVGDRCSECPDDSVDILQDRPLSYAPYDPKRPQDNTFAPYANAKSGLRGFRDPGTLRSGPTSPEAVGVWVADWQFVPCDWNHNKCAGLMRDMGYTTVMVPQESPGLDSFSMRPMSELRTERSFPKPWGKDYD